MSTWLSWLTGENPVDIITKEQFAAFFKLYVPKLDLPEVKARLKKAFEDGGSDNVLTMCSEIQKECFVECGVDPMLGLGSLRRLIKVYQGDQNIRMAIMVLAQREEMALREAEMSPEAFEAMKRQMESGDSASVARVPEAPQAPHSAKME